MKNKIFLIMFCMLLLVSGVYASNYKTSFDNKVGDYGKITIKDTKFLGLIKEKVADYTLEENTDICLINCEAKGNATLYEDGSLFSDIRFMNKESKEKQVSNQIYVLMNVTEEYLDENSKTQKITYEKWVDYNYEVLPSGEYEWKITGRKDAHDSVDWITTAFETELTEWAWWDSLSGGFQAFTSSGTFTVPTGITNISVLVVSGGGGSGGTDGGGSDASGGGGAGGLKLDNSYAVTPGANIGVIVGAGGSAGTGGNGDNNCDGSTGGKGSYSSFGTLGSTGGGGGGFGCYNGGFNGGSGGSGGGGGAEHVDTTYGGSGTAGQGNDGGDGYGYGGGGGGAGGVGADGSSFLAAGGVGLSVWGLATLSIGGDGWGGSAGTSNTGNGGDGVYNGANPTDGRVGGSGLVVVRWTQVTTTTLNSPTDLSTTNNPLITFDATSTTSGTLKNMTLYTNETGTWAAKNVTTGLSGTTHNEDWKRVLSDGYYTWGIETCILTGECTFSSVNKTFTIDTSPSITLNTPLNNTNQVENHVYFNCTVNSPYVDLANVSFMLDGAINETNSSGINGLYTFDKILADGYYDWTCEAYNDNSVYNIVNNYTLGVFNQTQFGLCNVSLTEPYLNVSFKDEESGEYINATADLFDVYYWFTKESDSQRFYFTNTTDNYYYNFCSNIDDTLYNTRSFQYASTGYPQRKYYAENSLESIMTNKTLYLLASGDGIYTNINVIDQSVKNVVGATVVVERQFSGVWTVVGQDDTDDSGSVTFWLNPNYDHRFTFSSDDCSGTVTTFRPTQSLYTQQLSCGGGENATYSSPYKGINYVVSPTPGSWLLEDTVKTFTFNITANLSNLVTYFINLTDKNGNQLNSTQGTTNTGGNLTLTLDTTGYETIYGTYYIDLGNGTYKIDPSIWSVRTIEAGRGSIYSFFRNLSASEPDIADNYNALMLIFLIIFVGMAAFTFSTGMELAQPGISLFIIFFFVAILSIAGYLTIDFAPSAFINQYGILLVVFFLTGGYTLGQWAKT